MAILRVGIGEIVSPFTIALLLETVVASTVIVAGGSHYSIAL